MRRKLLLPCLVLCAGVVPAAAMERPGAREPLAVVSAGADALEWTPAVDSEGATLTISDPQGHVRARRFAPGHAIVLPLFGAGGLPLADGTYTWELRFTTGHPGSAATPLVESGYFTIAGGAVVPFDLAEAAAGGAGSGKKAAVAADQIVPDDFVVDGKGCIGLGCVNNEPFGAEALRLKQSVVRLRFEDTSTTGGFSTRDWQLTANDSVSGGADRFSIEDLTASTTPLTVRGGAPTNSLHLASNGFIGLGTATPLTQLHVTGSDPGGASNKILVRSTGPFACREMFEIINNGCAAFVFKDATVPERWTFGTTGGHFAMDNQAAGGIEFVYGPTGSLTIAGNLTAANFPSSSRTLKENFVAVDPAAILRKIAAMPVTEWSFKEDPQHRRHIGPTVEDFRAAFNLGTNGQSLVVTDVNGVALAAIQALHTALQEQKVEIEALRRQIERLEAEPR